MSIALIGNGGEGSLFVQSGGEFTTADLFVGLQYDYTDSNNELVPILGTGWINVEDSGSILNVTSDGFVIGENSHGELFVGYGGKVVSVDHVSGWQDGEGNWVAELPDPANPPEGYVATTSSAWVHIGNAASAYGRLEVNGEGSVFQNDHAPTIVGNFGVGSVIINAGGLLSNPYGEFWVGSNEGSNGDVAVTGVGSRLIQYHPLGYHSEIGGAGFGTMTLNDGGYAEFTELHLGQMPTGLGVVNVWHPTTMLNITHGNLVVADQGMGFL
ncbi:MAG: hypothetical protein HC898_04300, partial [Phycisphaerales bacterium]|nr:hypothetical protein [Phycisphaerales bacterium]